MQKVYDLKQWYPGLPVEWKAGVHVFEINNLDGERYKDEKCFGKRCYFSGLVFLPACDVENNPEYWELIQKTTWSLEEINEAIEKWKFTSKNEELLLVSELKSEFGL